jgi:pimeloyl-ACP methyl ester carboxylesterase
MSSLHVERAGTGPALVLVHGYLGGSEQWSAEMRALSSNLDVVALDLPGFGRSKHLPAPDQISGYAEAVLDALDGLGIQRFHLLGHSMGGMVVQDMVRLAPERVDRLVLYATGPLGLLHRAPLQRQTGLADADGYRVGKRRDNRRAFHMLDSFG